MNFEQLKKLAELIDAKVYGNIRTEDLFTYLLGEIKELQCACKAIEYNPRDLGAKFNQIEEFGDVLFCLLAFARQNHIDIKQALSMTIIKLQDREKQKKKMNELSS